MSNNQHTKSIIRKVIEALSKQCRRAEFSLEHNGALGCLTIRKGVLREQRMKLLAGLAVAFTLTSHPLASQITTSQSTTCGPAPPCTKKYSPLPM